MRAVSDIRWMDRLGPALEEARRLNRALVVKPLGQGSGPCDDW